MSGHDHAHCHDHDHDCGCVHSATPYDQTLEELDFDRGLWPAARSGNLKKITELLRQGKSPSRTDRSGYTPLHYSARNGHLKACQLLLDARADPSAATMASQATPLHRAAYCGHTDVIKLLLHSRADPSLIDDDGQTPLHKAAESGKVAAALAIAAAIDKQVTTVMDRRGRTAEAIATERYPQNADLARAVAVQGTIRK